MVFWSKEKSKKDGTNMGHWERREQNTNVDKPLDFKNPVQQETWAVIGLVFGRYYGRVSITDLMA